MPQEVCGEGFIPLKRNVKRKVLRLAAPLIGWMDFDRFEFIGDGLAYRYDDIVAIGTAGDLDEFLEAVAAGCASAGWAHYAPDDQVWYYGPDERSKLEAEAAEQHARLLHAAETLTLAHQKLRALG